MGRRASWALGGVLLLSWAVAGCTLPGHAGGASARSDEALSDNGKFGLAVADLPVIPEVSLDVGAANAAFVSVESRGLLAFDGAPRVDETMHLTVRLPGADPSAVDVLVTSGDSQDVVLNRIAGALVAAGFHSQTFFPFRLHTDGRLHEHTPAEDLRESSADVPGQIAAPNDGLRVPNVAKLSIFAGSQPRPRVQRTAADLPALDDAFAALRKGESLDPQAQTLKNFIALGKNSMTRDEVLELGIALGVFDASFTPSDAGTRFRAGDRVGITLGGVQFRAVVASAAPATDDGPDSLVLLAVLDGTISPTDQLRGGRFARVDVPGATRGLTVDRVMFSAANDADPSLSRQFADGSK
jgi:hypothetical protein